MHKLTSSIFGLVVALVLGLGIQYVVAVGTWTAPTQTPPNGNVDAPINAGSSAQAKLGVLSLGKATTPTTGSTLDVNGIGLFQGLITSAFQLTTGAGAGKVLTSDANGVGSWTATSSLGLSGGINSSASVSNVQVYSTPGTYTWTVPTGVTKFRVKAWGAGGGSAPSCGGGAGGANTCNPTGGGAGGYSEGFIQVTNSTYTIVVGQGSTGAGGVSSVGSSIFANGGQVGLSINPSYGSILGGEGGTASGGYLNISGERGIPYVGGSAPLGGSGGQPYNDQTETGSFPGGGAGGLSGSGANGLVIIEY